MKEAMDEHKDEHLQNVMERSTRRREKTYQENDDKDLIIYCKQL